jgi:pimeloyl-ACP methyl ester carboxylesterase
MAIDLETASLIDIGDGPNEFVFLHGWCSRPGDFALQAQALSGDCRVLAPDWQDRVTAAGDACSPQAVCETIVALIEERGLARPILCGHSMGAFFATYIAKEKMLPHAGLLPIDTALPRPDGVRERYLDLCRELRAGPYETRYESFVTRTFFKPGEMGEKARSIIGHMVAQDPDIAISLLEQSCTADSGPSLAGIDRPMHVVASGVGVLDLDGLHEFVPQATGEQLDGTGHFITIFHADRVTAIVRAFIDRVTGE